MARKTPGLNTQSTADIAFLLLCYFLMTSTMDQQSGLQRRLPPMPDQNQKTEDTKVNKRNIIIVKINSSDRLFAGDQLLDVSQLKDKIKEFITNPNNDPNLPEREMKNIEGYGEYPVSHPDVSDRVCHYYLSVVREFVQNVLRGSLLPSSCTVVSWCP